MMLSLLLSSQITSRTYIVLVIALLFCLEVVYIALGRMLHDFIKSSNTDTSAPFFNIVF